MPGQVGGGGIFGGGGGGSVTLAAVTTALGTGTSTDNALARFDGAAGAMQNTDWLTAADSPSTGERLTFAHVEENLTIAAAATTTSGINIPAGAIVLSVSCRVTTVIPTATTFTLGVGGATTRYGSGLSTAAGTTNFLPGAVGNPFIYAIPTPLVVTPNLTPGDTTGRLRLSVTYLLPTAPTS